MARELDVYLHGRKVGVITDAGMNVYSFTYDSTATDADRLSVSLPVYPSGTFLESQTKPFFEGLLPEERVRVDIARQLGIDSSDSIGLFAAIGYECAGAVSVVDAGLALPADGGVDWLTEADLEARIDSLASFPLGRDNTARSRASLAGAQRKMVAVVEGDRVGIPRDATPSTHILKPQWQPGPDDPNLHGLVANESFCMRVAKHAGLEVADVEVRRIGDRPVLFVTRFDRRTVDGQVRRLHQEDIAQAGGRLPNSKYQEDGGMSLDDVAATLDRAGIGRRAAGLALLDTITVAAALGNADQHAKNIGILYRPEPTVGPLYDLTSTLVYEAVSKRAAFIIGGELYIDQIGADACIDAVVGAAGMPERLARTRVEQLAVRLRQAVDSALDDAHTEGWMAPVVDDIAALVRSWPDRTHQERWHSMPATYG